MTNKTKLLLVSDFPLSLTVVSSHSTLNTEPTPFTSFLLSSSPFLLLLPFCTMLSQHFCFLHPCPLSHSPQFSLSLSLVPSHSSGTWSTMLIRLSRCSYPSSWNSQSFTHRGDRKPHLTSVRNCKKKTNFASLLTPLTFFSSLSSPPFSPSLFFYLFYVESQMRQSKLWSYNTAFFLRSYSLYFIQTSVM